MQPSVLDPLIYFNGAVLVSLIAVFFITFLLGSIPWGVIISKAVFRKDLRQEGSGNIGATNAVRTLGKAGGIAVFLLDFCKGLLSGFIGLWIATYMLDQVAAGEAQYSVTIMLAQEGSAPYLALALAGCTLGHIFSPWLKFKGGKGIAVAVGAIFVVYGPWLTLLELGIFIVVVVLTRYISAGSLAAAVACPFVGLFRFWGDWFAVVVCALVGLVVIWAHRSNIHRLLNHEESRIGAGKPARKSVEEMTGDPVEGSTEAPVEKTAEKAVARANADRGGAA